MFTFKFLAFISILGYVLLCMQSIIILAYVYNFKTCIYIEHMLKILYCWSIQRQTSITLRNRCCVSNVMTVVNKKNKASKKQMNKVSFLIILKFCPTTEAKPSTNPSWPSLDYEVFPLWLVGTGCLWMVLLPPSGSFLTCMHHDCRVPSAAPQSLLSVQFLPPR